MSRIINGDLIPGFENLPGVDGKNYSLSDFSNKKILVILLSCNHCPYVKAYEERMMAFQTKYDSADIQLVAINSNETENYPDDNFEEMVKNAKQKNFNFIYLRDDDQSVADVFGATHTPEFFVFDNNWQNPGDVKEKYLEEAVEELLINEKVRIPETYSIGCTIKWK